MRKCLFFPFPRPPAKQTKTNTKLPLTWLTNAASLSPSHSSSLKFSLNRVIARARRTNTTAAATPTAASCSYRRPWCSSSSTAAQRAGKQPASFVVRFGSRRRYRNPAAAPRGPRTLHALLLQVREPAGPHHGMAHEEGGRGCRGPARHLFNYNRIHYKLSTNIGENASVQDKDRYWIENTLTVLWAGLCSWDCLDTGANSDLMWGEAAGYSPTAAVIISITTVDAAEIKRRPFLET